MTAGPVGIEVRVTACRSTDGHRALRLERGSGQTAPSPRLVSRAPLHTALRWVALMLAFGFAVAGAVLLCFAARAVRVPATDAAPGPDGATPDPGEVLAGRP